MNSNFQLPMQLIDDPTIFRPLVEQAIKRYGFASEHNLEWFLVYVDNTQKPVVAYWEETDEVVMAHKSADEWYTFSQPLAKPENCGRRVTELVDRVFKNHSGVKKIVIEANEDTRQQIIEVLPNTLRIIDHVEDQVNNYVLVWPIMNMEKFDPALPGKHFKYLRNARNKFYREHKIEIVDARTIPTLDLLELMDRWEQISKVREVEMIHADPYRNLIKNNFAGTITARGMVVDGKVRGFNAGWEIPNSKTFDARIGIHDYSISDLGLMLYLEDLEWIKKAGYPLADMGGVEEGSPLNFKNQFLPESWYKTWVFTIVRK